MHSRIGMSSKKHAEAAVIEGLSQAVSDMPLPDLTLLFYTGDYDLKDIFETAVKKLESKPLIGVHMPGLFNSVGIMQRGVAALTIWGVEAKTELLVGCDIPGYHIGQQLGLSLAENGDIGGTVLIFPSVHLGELPDVLRGIYSPLGPACKYFGGACVQQFTEAGFSRHGIAVVKIKKLEISNCIGHGWIPIGEPMLVTRAVDNEIFEFDGIPAAQRYKNLVNDQLAENSVQLGNQNALSIVCLGIPCTNREFLIRDIFAVEDHALICSTGVPQNSVVTLMTTSIPALPVIAMRITKEALAYHNNPEFALLFSGISRYDLLQEKYAGEVNNIYQVLDELPAIGLLTYGEISSSLGIPLYHNKSLSVVIGG